MTTTSDAYYPSPSIFIPLPTHPAHAYHLTPPPSPLLTPPPIRHEGSPYACVPLPPVPEDPQPSTPLSINRFLRYSSKPTISFDLSQNPSTITSLPDHRPLSLDSLCEPATIPLLERLTIVSPHLPWRITVTAPHTRTDKYVTVSDVLVALHRRLGVAVSVTEYGTDVVVVVREAYERRVKEVTGKRSREAARRMGVKRIDFLMGQHRFLGLSRMGDDLDVFVLNVF